MGVRSPIISCNWRKPLVRPAESSLIFDFESFMDTATIFMMFQCSIITPLTPAIERCSRCLLCSIFMHIYRQVSLLLGTFFSHILSKANSILPLKIKDHNLKATTKSYLSTNF